MQWILQDIPIGRNIQAIRIEKKLTQEQVVAKLQLMGSNMSRSTLANIEVGRRNIKASDLRALKKMCIRDSSSSAGRRSHILPDRRGHHRYL